MKPIIILTVGYITGIIWGLYLKINIVPFVCFIILGTYLLNKIKNIKKYFILFLISLIISNIQINYLENKFNHLYLGLNQIEVTRNCDR